METIKKQNILKVVEKINQKDRADNQISLAVGYFWHDNKICALNPTWNPTVEAIYNPQTKKTHMAY